MSKKYLTIIESAYRATIEEQDDTALWFMHAMKNGGAEVTIVLRGNAVNYAVKGQVGTGLKFGERAVKGPDIAHDVSALVAKKVPVLVIGEDVAARGIAPTDFLDGIEQVSAREIAKLAASHDHILHF